MTTPDIRELQKWLNEQPNRPLDKADLARVLHELERLRAARDACESQYQTKLAELIASESENERLRAQVAPAGLGFSPMWFAPLDGTPVMLYMPTCSDKFAVGRWHGDFNSISGNWGDDEGNYYTHQPVSFMALSNLERIASPAAPAQPTQVRMDLLCKLRAYIVWHAFGECRSPGWDGPPPTAREAVGAIDMAFAASPAAPAQQAEPSAGLGIPPCGGPLCGADHHPLCKQAPSLTVGDREAAAKAIYALFDGAADHPWVEGGNSFKQDEARRYARVALEAQPAAQAEPVGSFMTREQAIEHCRKRRAGIEPTEQHIAATIDAYSALFGDLVPASFPGEPVAWVVRKPQGYNDVGYESAKLNKLPHGTMLYAGSNPPAQHIAPKEQS